MAFEDILDQANRFHTEGLSREDIALLEYLRAAKQAMGADLVCTCTTDHAELTTSGNRSRHRTQGTDGEGLAIDARMRRGGITDGLHRPVFDAFTHVETKLHELIYAFPPSGRRADGSVGPYNIKAGKRVRPFAVSTHKDHVHISVNKGVFVAFPRGNPVEDEMLFPDTRTTLVPGVPPRANNRWACWGWKPDGSVFCWNFDGLPVRVPSVEEKAELTRNGTHTVIGLHPRSDGTFGYVLVTDEADENGGLMTFTF